MADGPPQLPYARPDRYRPRPNDLQVQIGSGLQLIGSGTCLALQVGTWISPPGGAAGRVQWYLLTGFLCLGNPALSAVALAGSLGRNRSRRRTLYTAYLWGLAVSIAVPMAAIRFRPEPGDEPGRWWVLLPVQLIVNPVAFWIVGRGVVARLFPPKPRPVRDLVWWEEDSGTFPGVIDDLESTDLS